MRTDIISDRLMLKRMQLSDAESIADLANHPDVSATTMRMPYPCDVAYIRNWIRKDMIAGADKSGFFTIRLIESSDIIGVIGLEVDKADNRGELGYWLGVNYWDYGYCTEAARMMLAYGFDVLRLNRIWTIYIEGNHASRRVLEKIGMQYEGTLRKHIKKNGVFKDLIYFGLLKETYADLSHPTINHLSS